MNHEDFVKRAKEVLQLEQAGEIDAAVVKIRSLLEDLVVAVRNGVNDWHQQQALGILVNTLSSTNRKDECQSAWNDLIQFNKDQLKYWEVALTSSNEHFEDWKDSNFSKD